MSPRRFCGLQVEALPTVAEYPSDEFFASFFAEKKEGPVAAATESLARKCNEKKSRAKSREAKAKPSRSENRLN